MSKHNARNSLHIYHEISSEINYCCCCRPLVTVVSDSATAWTTVHQPSQSFTISWNLLRFMFIESVMPPNHLILRPLLLLLPQSFPASGAFPVSQLFPSCDQSTGASASASVLPINISFKIDWFDLLLSKGLSRVFSSTTIGKHQLLYHNSVGTGFNSLAKHEIIMHFSEIILVFLCHYLLWSEGYKDEPKGCNTI